MTGVAGDLGVPPTDAPRPITTRERPKPLRRSRSQRRPNIIEQEMFRDLLIRERKRSDRFEQPFVLVLVAANDQDLNRRAWAAAVDALSAVRRDTDVLGWFERGSVLGVILSDLEASGSTDVQERVQRALTTRAGVTATQFLVRVYVYSGPSTCGATSPGSTESLLLDVQSSRAPTAGRHAVKRGLDIVGSLSLLTLTAPLFMVVAALVKLGSRGPVFFRQARVGQFGEPFTMLKFRTMQVNADHAIHQEFMSRFITSSVPSTITSDGIFKIVNDPRVTSLGRFLRKTSLDELPQLWNVLRGEMSLVGPRPPLQYEVTHYKPWHRRRLFEAKPGITGLWQVTGRSRTTFDEMVRLDLRYARTSSLATDLKILLATLSAVNTGEGAC